MHVNDRALRASRLGRQSHRAHALHQSVGPGPRRALVADLYIQVITEPPRAHSANMLHDIPQPILERTCRPVPKNIASPCTAAKRVAYPLRPVLQINRLTFEAGEVLQPAEQVVNGDEFLVRADVYHIAQAVPGQAELQQAGFRLTKRLNSLPYQYYLFFERL